MIFFIFTLCYPSDRRQPGGVFTKAHKGNHIKKTSLRNFTFKEKSLGLYKN
jgi:hypothetical protein